MKNKEKFAKEIIEIACSGNSIAVIKKSGHIAPCNNTNCNLCLFRDSDCRKETRQWAESEYIEKPVISKRDRAFLEYINANIHYMARDLDGGLYAYISKPHKLIVVGKVLDVKRTKACECLISTSQWSNGKMTNRGLSRT